MKRFWCLSATALAFSAQMALSGSAIASPVAEDSKVVAKNEVNPTVTTVQATDPSSGSGTTTDPTAAPTDGSAPTQPAVTVGTSPTTPGADAPAEAAEEPAPKPKPRPWAGTNIFATTAMTTGTIFQGQQQTHNPTVDSTIFLLPRYSLGSSFQLRGRLLFTYEWTNNDFTSTRNEPRFSDTTLQLFYRDIPEIPVVGIKPLVAATVMLPSSPESRARTMYVSPGLTLQLAKAVEHVLGGDLLFLSNIMYLHPIYGSTTPEIRTDMPYTPSCFGGGGACTEQLSGIMNPSDILSYSLMVIGEWGHWAPGLGYFGGSQWTYSPRAVNDQFGRPIVTTESFRPASVRQTSFFTAWLDYNINAWLTAEVGYQLSRSLLDAQGQISNPFFDRYQDMRVYLGANFAIDNIMKALEGGPTDAGIVRAKGRSPIFNY